MGMAASQGRLLMMTARLSNNEFEQQCVAYSKQRLADDSLDANDRYLEAMNATKYQVITGYNGNNAMYEDVTYNQLTGLNNVAVGKQYIVNDNKGRIVVSSAIAKAFEAGNGDYNKFLAAMGVTQCDIDITDDTAAQQAIHEAWDKYLVSVYDGKNDRPDIEHNPDFEEDIFSFGYRGFAGSADIFDGYPTYEVAKFSNDNNSYPVSIGYKDNIPYYYMERYEVSPVPILGDNDEISGYQAIYVDSDNNYHILENINVEYDEEKDRYTYEFTNADDVDVTTTSNITTLYVNRDAEDSENPKIYTSKEENMEVVLDEDGVIKKDENGNICYKSNEDKEYAFNTKTNAIFYEGTTDEQRNLYDYAVSITEAYYHTEAQGTHSMLKNDANLQTYYKNIYNQMITFGYTTYNGMIKEGYMNATETNENKAFQDDQWLITQLKQGKLTIAYFSAVDRAFVKTTLDDDESITEKEDKAKIKLAEQAYNTSMNRIEKEDKMFDLQLNKLESEHSALQTEYESVAKVISKNVEKSFGTFNA